MGSESQIKIAILMPLAEQRGGGEMALLHLLQSGRQQGVEWLVIFLESGPMVDQVRALGIETLLVPAGRLSQVWRFGSTVRKIAAIMRSSGTHILLSWMGKPHLYGCWAARMAGRPSIWFQLGLPTSKDRMDRLISRLPTDGILACSHAVAEAQTRLGPQRPIRVVHLGAEIERFDPDLMAPTLQVRERLGLPLQGPVIGIVGRMQRWKGMHTLIEAMPAILRVHPETTCLIVGGEHSLEPDYPVYLEERITALSLQERVVRTGLQRNVPEWMQAMDVIVHASDWEPFGIVVIEGMAMGKPVVAGSEGGPTEMITDGVDGLLSPFEDADRLAAAVLRFLDDPVFACRVAEAGRRRAQQFSTQQYALNLIHAVRELCPQSA